MMNFYDCKKSISLSLISACTALFLLGCGQSEDSTKVLSSATSKTGALDLPVLLIHGSGNQAKAVNAVSIFGNNLKRLGYTSPVISTIRYNWQSDLATNRKVIARQIVEIFNRYSPEQKFVIAGHSLGGFMSVYVPLTSKLPDQNSSDRRLSSKISMFIELAGVSRGIRAQDVKVPIISSILRNGSSTVEALFDHAGFIDPFYQEYSGMISNILHCSIVSPNDQLVSNRNSSLYDHTIQIEILKYATQQNIFRAVHNKTKVHYQVAEHLDSAKAAIKFCFNF